MERAGCFDQDAGCADRVFGDLLGARVELGVEEVIIENGSVGREIVGPDMHDQ
jgi:hypothetical protein